MKKIITLSFALFLSYLPCFCTIMYVNQNVIGGNNDGSTWINAFVDLQNALLASQSGDTIWVAKGIYLPTQTNNREISFEIKDGVVLMGGFSGNELSLTQRDWILNETILSGEIGEPDNPNFSDNTFNVVFAQVSTFVSIDGFTITRGKADYNNVNEPLNSRKKNGGGCYFSGGDSNLVAFLEIRNCKFFRNSAYSFGGGVYLDGINIGTVLPTISDCVFERNLAKSGGGIYQINGDSFEKDMEVLDCKFIKNSIDGIGGGAICIKNTLGFGNNHIKRCVFEGNFGLLGGAINYEDENSGKLIIDSCHFYSNIGIIQGGAIYSSSIDNANSLEIYNSTFTENFTTLQDEHLPNTGIGGAINILSFPIGNLPNETKIYRCNFLGNVASGGGGAIHNDNSRLNISDCLFAGNTAINGDGGAVLFETSYFLTVGKFTNCTFFKNKGLNGGAFRSFMSANSTQKPFFNFRNCIFSENSALEEGDLGKSTKMNVNFFSCLTDEDSCDSLVFADTPPSFAVICDSNMLFNGSPFFTDTVSNDFTLLPCSPARHVGNNNFVQEPTDLAGNPRIQGGIVDMGAYESPAFSIASHVVASAPCAGSPGSLSLNLSHGCPPFSIEWQGGSASADSPSVTLTVPAGSHQFTITDARGETDTLQITIIEPPALSAQATASGFACGGSTGGSATFDVQGGTSPYIFLWNNQTTEPTLENLPTGSYTVTATDANGCAIADTVQVEATGNLNLSISVTPIHCHDAADGTATVLPVSGAAPFAWFWQGGQMDSTLTGLSGGSYSVTVTDALGCTGDLQFSLDAPDTLNASVTGTDVRCFGAADGTATASASGGTEPYNFLWSNQQATPIATNLAPGWHSVTVTDVNGCTDTAGVYVGTPSQLSAGIEAPGIVCFGEPAPTLAALAGGGTPPYSFFWNIGSTDSLLVLSGIGSGAGSYQLTVTDALDCSQQASVSIDSSHIQALFEIKNATGAAVSDGAVNVELVFGGESPFTFLWSNGATTQSLQNVPPGNYVLTVTDADSCQQVFYFTVDIESAAAHLPQATSFSVRIAPNPAGQASSATRMLFEASKKLHLNVKMLDTYGRKVWERALEIEPGKSQSNLPGQWAAGTYWLVFIAEDGESVAVKFVVI